MHCTACTIVNVIDVFNCVPAVGDELAKRQHLILTNLFQFEVLKIQIYLDLNFILEKVCQDQMLPPCLVLISSECNVNHFEHAVESTK